MKHLRANALNNSRGTAACIKESLLWRKTRNILLKFEVILLLFYLRAYHIVAFPPIYFRMWCVRDLCWKREISFSFPGIVFSYVTFTWKKRFPQTSVVQHHQKDISSMGSVCTIYGIYFRLFRFASNPYAKSNRMISSQFGCLFLLQKKKFATLSKNVKMC